MDPKFENDVVGNSIYDFIATQVRVILKIMSWIL